MKIEKVSGGYKAVDGTYQSNVYVKLEELEEHLRLRDIMQSKFNKCIPAPKE